MRSRLVLPALLALATGGCAGSATPPLATSPILGALPRVDNSSRAPCWQQQQVAEQNSYLASIAAGKTVVYKAPCVVDPQAPAPQPGVNPKARVAAVRTG